MLSPSCLPAGVATSLRNAAHPKTHPQFSFKGFYIFPECNREQSQRLDGEFSLFGNWGEKGVKKKMNLTFNSDLFCNSQDVHGQFRVTVLVFLIEQRVLLCCMRRLQRFQSLLGY
jgi:hypothetical protein